MPGIRPKFASANLYFITTTAVNHAHLFQRDIMKQIIADSLSYARAQAWIHLHCFVVMPNHLHMIVSLGDAHTVADVLRDFKKYTAKQIIRQYENEDNRGVLQFLARMGRDAGNQQYKIWEDGYDARDVFSRDFLRQKMEYVHNNPCQPHWQLVERPEDYMWSSARFYIHNEPTIITVDDVRGMMD